MNSNRLIQIVNHLVVIQKISIFSAAILSAFVLGLSVHAQSTVKDLQAEIDSGQVSLVAATGNGNSTGMVISAYLENRTNVSKRVSINLNRPLYLVNSGKGQNMAAVQVYRSGGGYSKLGNEMFITLGSRARESVEFLAFCVDFEKDNPTSYDRFTIGSAPYGINSVLANIRTYIIANPDEDIGSAGQAALWMAQGVSIAKIRERFAVSYEEERLARQFLR